MQKFTFPVDRCIYFAILFLFLCATGRAVAESPTTAPTTASTTNFTGEWRSTFGPMTLTQTGIAIEGRYDGATHGRVKGVLDGNKFLFKYAEAGTGGVGWFEMADDGRSFKGRWREDGTQGWAEWVGQRKEAANSFTGLWKTTYGRMRLHQNGDQVHGVFDFDGISHLTGFVKDGALHVEYEQGSGEKGQATFTLDANGGNFTGTWKRTSPAKQGEATKGPWVGERMRPRPDIVWLVVLEANWEKDLAEREYSFGSMLRTFFTRVPDVQVRHRFFGDEADFRRWCGELAFLAEPIVLHVSSHGSREGVACGGKVLGAEVLADCFRDAGDLKLVHFGTCLLGGGEIPRKIQKSLGADATFPISGYINAADWGASAIVDFTYLELVLSHEMNPAKAVEQTRKMLAFARETGDANDALSPAGLVIFEPSTVPTTQPAAK